MASVIGVVGAEDVTAALRRAGIGIAVNVEAGLLEAGYYLEAESRRIVPVHLSDLKGSSFTRMVGRGYDADVVVGYTKDYAIYVHENMDAAHGREFNVKYAEQRSRARTRAQKKYYARRGPDQQAKFLEKPAREKRGQMLAIIEKHAGRRPL